MTPSRAASYVDEPPAAAATAPVDAASWRAACDADGVVSFYDYGLRVAAPAADDDTDSSSDAGRGADREETTDGAEESDASPEEWWAGADGVDDTLSGIFANSMPPPKSEFEEKYDAGEIVGPPAPAADEAQGVVAGAAGGETEEATSETKVDKYFRKEDVVGSEWKVGLLWKGKDQADVTWARCEEDGSVTWGFGARGKWRVDEVRGAVVRGP